ncbi:hypothetical protein V8B97DRAFT_1985189 [Scleroderma yunnanense]
MFILVSRFLLFALAALDIESTIWRAISFALVVSFAVADLVTPIGNVYADLSCGIFTGTIILEASRYLLLTRPLEEFRHESDKFPAYQLPFMQRFFWLMNISPRGVGWSFKDDRTVSIDPRHRARGAFIVSRLRAAFVQYLFFEVAALYARTNPAFTNTASLGSQGYILRCLSVVVACSPFYALLCFGHSLLAVVAVATNLSEPQEWPYPFGLWEDAYTIRRFWARTWHQFNRYILTIFGPHRFNRRPWDETVDPTIRKPKEPWSRTYLRLCIAFALSALMHVAGDVALQFSIWAKHSPAGTLSSGKVYPPLVIGVSAPTFFLQPLGVLVEDGVIAVGKRFGVKTGTWTKIIGYAWVWLWMSFSVVPTLDGLKNAIQIASPGHEYGAGAGLLERTVGILFGVDLLSIMSSWFARL